MKIKTVNTILYCKKWLKTVYFYKTALNLPVLFSKDWFIEFELNNTSRLSIADETRTTMESNAGKGLTITMEVENIDETFSELSARGIILTPLKKHPWGAMVCYAFDPEGNRLEFWTNISSG